MTPTVLIIQIVLIAAVLAVGAVLVRSTAGERHQAIRRLLLGLLVLLAVASILAPGLVTAVARAVGVGRGTDLLLYGLVIAFLGALVSAYRRQRALESRLTELTRRLALDEAEPPALARSRRAERCAGGRPAVPAHRPDHGPDPSNPPGSPGSLGSAGSPGSPGSLEG